MKILFLDIDGVVNTGPKPGIAFHWADPELVENLNSVINETGCFVVISSSWKIGETLDSLRKIFVEEFGIVDRFIGMTPDLWNVPRSKEIRQWLSDNAQKLGVERFAVVDDNFLHETLFSEEEFFDEEIQINFVRLGRFQGLSTRKAEKLKNILGRLTD